ncbi:MAG TPA: hypothetical protein PL108_01280 [Sediminibacterium sp.]|jgi:hypothetical protein|nr:MAG: hypothetical protein BWY38_02837 [Ignavibacteria bacterium ADurb.Bin266]HPH36259.1 hypothetical protein [Sediminibacterium sp.]
MKLLKHKTSMMEYLINHSQSIIIAGGFLTLCGGYLTYLKSEKDSNTTNQKLADGINKTQQVIDLTNKVNHLNKSNETLLKTNIDLTNLNNSLIQKNLEVSAGIDKSTGKINSYITGANSFCFMGILFPTIDNETEGVFYFNTIGDFPLKDIHVKILDLDYIQTGVFKNMFDIEKSFEIQTLKPNKITITQFPVKLNKEKQNNFKIILSTNAGDFIQESKYRYVKDRWLTADRVLNAKTKETLLQRVDPQFGDPQNIFEK